MKRYSEQVIKLARNKVAFGKSCTEVSKDLGVSRTQVSLWCRDVGKTKFLGLVKYNENRRKTAFDSEKFILHRDFEIMDLKLLCSLLYGCEGSKYPASSGISFVNSDPRLISAFTNLMRKIYQVNEFKWRVHLQIHSNQNFEGLRKYWSDLLSIPYNQFLKPTVTVAKEGKHRKEYWGTCSLRYGDFQLQLKLIGIFDEFLGKYSNIGEVA